MAGIVTQDWRQARRDRLVAAARTIFAVSGFERASMDEIAAAAGAGKPTLYRYFASKEALFEAVFVEALDDLERRLAEAERAATNPLDGLRRMLAAILPIFREHVAPLRQLGEAASGADNSRRRILRGRSGEIEARLAAVLRRGREAGLFRHGDDILTARLVYGMIWSGSAGSEWSDDAVCAAILGLVRGVRQRPQARASANGDPPSSARPLQRAPETPRDGVPL